MVMKISPKHHAMTSTLQRVEPAFAKSKHPLSASTERVFRFIKDYVRTTNTTPTIREIMRYVGFRSTNSVYKQLKKLEEAGVIHKASNGRIQLMTLMQGTSVLGGVAAGFSTPVKETTSELLSLDEFLITHPKQTFLLTVSGDSMVNAGVLDGDYILVEQGSPYASGDMVVVRTETGFRIKYYIHEQGQTCLRSANPGYAGYAI